MHYKAFKKELGLIKKTKKTHTTFLEINLSTFTFIKTEHSCLIIYFLQYYTQLKIEFIGHFNGV